MRKFVKFFFLITLFICTVTYPVYAFEIGNLVVNQNEEIIKNETNPNKINLLASKNYNIEEISLYQESEEIVEVFSHQNQKVGLTKDDINLMAAVVYAESKGEPYDGKVAVASVILNRVINYQFPNTVKGVITQKNAFSCVKNGQIPYTNDKACYKAVYAAIGGYDPTNSCCFFYNPKIATCNWMKGISKSNQRSIGNHVFFNA